MKILRREGEIIPEGFSFQWWHGLIVYWRRDKAIYKIFLGGRNRLGLEKRKIENIPNTY